VVSRAEASLESDNRLQSQVASTLSYLTLSKGLTVSVLVPGIYLCTRFAFGLVLGSQRFLYPPEVTCHANA
jgi:hypothetical protein